MRKRTSLGIPSAWRPPTRDEKALIQSLRKQVAAVHASDLGQFEAIAVRCQIVAGKNITFKMRVKGGKMFVKVWLKLDKSAQILDVRFRSHGWIFGPSPEPIEKFYKFNPSEVGSDRIGQAGQFGYAVRGRVLDKKSATRHVAIKIIRKSRFTGTAEERELNFEAFRSEIEVMQRMNHKHIIRLHRVFETKSVLYLVMDLCEGGELFDMIQEQGSFSERDASEVMRMIFEGLRYMHSKKIAHCDIKPDNFLFAESKRSRSRTLKIIDFGMSKFRKGHKYFAGLCGTSFYVAPEVISGAYSEECDMWSAGVVLFVMLFGFPPFHVDEEELGGDADNVIFEMIQHGFDPRVREGYGPWFPSDMPITASARNLITNLLTKDTLRRYSAAEALAHPWVSGNAASEKPLSKKVFENLQLFNTKGKIKLGMVTLMRDVLTPSEVEGLLRSFKDMDANGDGVITAGELRQSLLKTAKERRNESEISRLIQAVAGNESASLSYEAIQGMLVAQKLLAKEERLWALFCRLDKNQDGKISVQELNEALNTTDGKELIADIDVNKDGHVDYEEFMILWRSKKMALKRSRIPILSRSSVEKTTHRVREEVKKSMGDM